MSEPAKTPKTYNPFELFKAYDGPVPDSFVERRRVSQALQQLTDKLIRIEANDAQLSDWAARLEALAAEAEPCARLDTKDANRKLFSGRATAEDVFHMMDYDPVGGASNPIAPQLEWIKHAADGVQARANLGMAYQGPPGRVHGGVIAWMLDSVLSRALHASMRIGMTGTLNLRYQGATPLYADIDLRAQVTSQAGRKIFVEGGIWVNDEQTVVAEGVWLVPKSLGM